MNYIYEIATGNGTCYKSIDELNSDFEVLRYTDDFGGRAELNGQPKIKGFLGPMWGGYVEGMPCVRYETSEVYASLSI